MRRRLKNSSLKLYENLLVRPSMLNRVAKNSEKEKFEHGKRIQKNEKLKLVGLLAAQDWQFAK